MISVIIPSVNDPCLQKTVDSITRGAKGEIEVIVSLDTKREGLRAMVNRGVQQSKGEYILKTDDHCMFDDGWDEKLLAHIEDSWIVVPRRYKLDTTRWRVIDEPPIDYERLLIDRPDKIGGVHWNERRVERQSLQIDETMVFQGSCYFMSRQHWNALGGLQEAGYGPFAQEAIELALKTWLGGGKVMVNKTTWYAHKHRKFGRVVSPNKQSVKDGNAYSRDYWLNNRWGKRVHDLDWLMKRFGL